ncbi:PTS fructose transporter subunit IIABC [Treponema zioleckii]|uniref:PTS fructose transporter subunit IIABC n=1 Tax=Treponema zioleckii TaxID=331680 RepID=UPI00168A6A98|nr:fructose-specific PTS transporter subunit EIIC [Treponema zioleckii]
MRIRDLLAESSIALHGSAKDKKDVIDQMVKLMAKNGNITDVEAYKNLVLAREEESTTAVGEGVAIPHGKGSCVSRPGLAAMVLDNGVDYDSPDGEPVRIIFLIAAPNTKDNVHVDVLSKLSVLLLDENFTKSLLAAKSVSEFLKAIDVAENAKDANDSKKNNTTELPAVLAVTACPTGIAHTYMAEESLKKAAKKLGVTIKVETRGTTGAKNVLTEEEINSAKAIIVAADTQVPMARFAGKKVIECRVAEGINNAEKLIYQATNGDVPTYVAKDEGSGAASSNSGGHSIYKHLMTGVSHMLPFVVGGGILIALAFLIDGIYCKMNGITPDGTFGSMTAVSAFLKGKVGGVAFGFMLPVLAGFIAYSIADRAGLVLGFVGGAIAANGTSGFLGALVAGFFAGYTILALKKCFSVLPKSLEGIKSILIYPLIGVFIVGLGMVFVIEPIVGFINQWLNTGLNHLNGASSIVLGLLVGGMMAVDMGGPVNKAAYVFATGMLAEGHYDIMAAVMVGGMCPPIAIAAATMIFKSKFTAEERKAGPVNFIMGLSFITEGAIPYAAADPSHVLPSCIVGSAVAGALSMLFKCTLMAPHGGIFVFPVVGNPVLYLVALAIGSAVSCIMLGVLKKDVDTL